MRESFCIGELWSNGVVGLTCGVSLKRDSMLVFVTGTDEYVAKSSNVLYDPGFLISDTNCFLLL